MTDLLTEFLDTAAYVVLILFACIVVAGLIATVLSRFTDDDPRDMQP